jgi:hypothetical protein
MTTAQKNARREGGQVPQEFLPVTNITQRFRLLVRFCPDASERQVSRD